MALASPRAFGARLKRERVARGLTQEALAERAGLSARAISDLERGVNRTPRKETLRLLAEALQLSSESRARLEEAVVAAVVVAPERGASTSFADSTPLPLAGRTQELALIGRYLQGEGPPLLLLAGEPGIGKTRLLRETATRAQRAGWRVLSGGCTRRSAQASYAPFTVALAQSIAHTARAQLRRDLQGCAWLARLLPELLEKALAPAPTWQLPAEHERRLLFAAVGRYLTNVSGPAGTLVLLDDLQWADGDALDLLESLLRDAAAASQEVSETPATSLRVVGAYRDTEVRTHDPLEALLADLARDRLARRLALGPLAPHDAATLLEHLSGGVLNTSDTVAARLLDRTGGVPFFLVSCAQALRVGALDASTETGAAEGIPWNVAQSVRQRVAALSLEAQELLSTAAVIGRQCRHTLLVKVATQLGSSRRDTVAALEAACRAGLLIEDGSGAYQFAHDLILEVIVADLSVARRMSLHHEVAEAIKQLPGELPLEQLAYHYARSDDKPATLFYLEQAGDRAAGRYAHAEAESHYRAACDLARELNDRRREGAVREKLGTTLMNVARYDEAIAALAEAEQLHRVMGDLEGQARALAQLGYVHTRQGTPSAGIARVQPSLEPLATKGLSARGRAMLQFTLATLYNNGSLYAEELEMAEQAVELARSLGDDALAAQTQAVRGMALMHLGRLDEAVLTLEEAASVAETVGDLLTLSRAFMNLMGTHIRRGAFAQARASGERAREYVEQSGDPALTTLVCCNCGNAEYLVGEWSQARALYQQAAETIRGVRLSYAAPAPSLGLGQLCLAEGKSDEAVRLLAESISLARSSEVLTMLRPAQAALAERDLLEGRPETALERLTPLLDRHPGQEEAEATALLLLVAWAYLEMDRHDRAAEVVAKSLARAFASGQRLVLPDALRVQALLALRQRRWYEAENALEQACAIARAMPYPYTEAKVLHIYGLLYRELEDPERARERFAEALTICVKLGERLYRPHIERALASL
jgi:tetratricopeptide (TPR) repeat protein/transcriptional regulator with XRE-family HTH domain